MSAKHTRGPWHVQPGFLTIYALSNGDSGTTNAIGTVLTAREGGSSVTPEEVEANARLIAAAPELLEAAQALLDDPNEVDNPLAFDGQSCPASVNTGDDRWVALKAALAKATGGDS